MLSIRRAALLSVTCLVALSACTAEVERAELSPADRAAVLKIEETNDAVASLQDCLTDLATCLAGAGLDPVAVAACGAEAATCAAEGAGAGGVPLPPGVPPIPDPPDIDLQPIVDCHTDMASCLGTVVVPSDLTLCVIDLNDCLDDATSGICDSATELCMSLPVSVPECDQLDLACS